MPENDLERRIEQLENKVYSNSNSDSSDKIGYLQNKIRDLKGKMDELEKNLQTVRTDVEHKEEIESVAEDIKSDVKWVENNLEDFDDRIEEANDLVDEFYKAEETLDKVVDLWNEEMQKYDDIVMKQAKDLADWVLLSHRVSFQHFRREWRYYIPQGDTSQELWNKAGCCHLLSKEDFGDLFEFLNSWKDLVDEIERHGIETPTNLRRDIELFEVYICRKENQQKIAEMQEQGKSFDEAMQEIYGHLADEMDTFDEWADWFDVNVDDHEGTVTARVGEQISEGKARLLMAEMYSSKKDFSDSDKEEMIESFLSRFPKESKEAYQQMVEFSGIDPDGFNKWLENRGEKIGQ